MEWRQKDARGEIRTQGKRGGRGEIRMREQEERNSQLVKGSAFHFLNFNVTEKGLKLLRELIGKAQD